MNKKFLLIGGDLRIINLAKLLANDGNIVNVCCMEKSDQLKEDKRIIEFTNIEEAIESSEIIVSSIPFIKNQEIYTPFSDNHIILQDLIKNKYKDKIFIAGSITEKAKEKLSETYLTVKDLMEQEELAILNTIATAEGAIEIAINNTDKIIHESKILILGFGRVGKVVAKKFEGLCAKISCAARKNEDLAWIETLGYTPVNINHLGENLGEYDIIINTVPQIILNKNELQYMKKDVLLIDLASAPGGINQIMAKELNLKFIWALALPRKNRTCIFCNIYKTKYI